MKGQQEWEEGDEKPQVKSGWGMGGSDLQSNVGIAKKSNAEQYWDNKTTELIIPEMEVDNTDEFQAQISEPPKVDQKMLNLRELEKDTALNVPSVTREGIDISLLTSVIHPIADLVETDMSWDYLSLQAEIGQNFRERFGQYEEAEGTESTNV